MATLHPQEPASNKYCRAWDRIFHHRHLCPPPSAQDSTTEIDFDDGRSVFALIAAMIGIGIVVVMLLSMWLGRKRKRRLIRAHGYRERRVQAQPQNPSLVRQVSTWWASYRSHERSRPREVEMGRFKRGLSRVRSVAKPTPEINIATSNHIIQTPSQTRTRAAPEVDSSPRLQRTPRYAPPAYENTPSGNPISDQFMSDEARGVEPRVGTPPPTYYQRTGDDVIWEDDGRPAPGYSHPWLLA